MDTQTLLAIAKSLHARIDSGSGAKFARFENRSDADRFYAAVKARNANRLCAPALPDLYATPYPTAPNLTTVAFIPEVPIAALAPVKADNPS